MNPNCTALIGSGVVVHVPSFFEELESLEKKGTSELALLRTSASAAGGHPRPDNGRWGCPGLSLHGPACC